MIEYWTFWNYSWFLLYRFKLIPYTYALKTSIFITSMVGGYIAHIHPEELYLNFFIHGPRLQLWRVRILPWYRFFGDLLLHQYPLYYILTNDLSIHNSCGLRVMLPLIPWYIMNKRSKLPCEYIYSTKMNNILGMTSLVIGSLAIHYHLLGNMNVRPFLKFLSQK